MKGNNIGGFIMSKKFTLLFVASVLYLSGVIPGFVSKVNGSQRSNDSHRYTTADHEKLIGNPNRNH